jgi:hypothetical protein
VTAIQSIQPIFPGSSPNVTCVAELDDTVDVPLVVTIMFGTTELPIDSDYSVHMESYTRYTRTFTIENIRESQEYICVFMLLYSDPSILLPQNMSVFDISLNVSISKL